MNRIIKKMLSHKKIYALASLIKIIRSSEVAERVWGIWQDKDELVIKHYGDELPGKIVYYININDDQGGFFAELRWICTLLLYSDRRGFVPYVRLGEKNRYYDTGITTSSNPFEYYFLPVSEIDMDKVLKAQNVVNFEIKHLKEVESKVSFQMDSKIVSEFAFIWKKYIHLNERTNTILDKSLNQLHIDCKKTLGVHVRGTDFKLNYNGHPIAVSAEEELKLAISAMEQYNYEQIFLATDELSTIELFRKYFKDRLVYYEDVYRSSNGIAVHDSYDSRYLHHYKLGLEVLRDAITLSRCRGLIAGQSNVSFFSMLINEAEGEKYEYCHICDKGMNHNNKIYKKYGK